MLEVIKESLLPFAQPESGHDADLRNALRYFTANPAGNINELAATLGCSKRSTERIVAELKTEGCLVRIGGAAHGRWEAVPEERSC